MTYSDRERAIGLAMLERCSLLSLPRWPKRTALPSKEREPPAPPRKTDGTA